MLDVGADGRAPHSPPAGPEGAALGPGTAAAWFWGFLASTGGPESSPCLLLGVAGLAQLATDSLTLPMCRHHAGSHLHPLL